VAKEAHRVFGRERRDRPTDSLYELPASASGGLPQSSALVFEKASSMGEKSGE
jgi:hypothetical protein